jgi:hypothetical protein
VVELLLVHLLHLGLQWELPSAQLAVTAEMRRCSARLPAAMYAGGFTVLSLDADGDAPHKACMGL